MCPLRPTAIATPGATASSMAVLTILSSFPLRAVSRPELLSPTSGSMYLIGIGGATTTLAGGGGAQAATTTRDMIAAREDFMRRLRVRERCIAITRKRRLYPRGTTCDPFFFGAPPRLAARGANAVPDQVAGSDGISVGGEGRAGRGHRARERPVAVRGHRPHRRPAVVELVGQQK